MAEFGAPKAAAHDKINWLRRLLKAKDDDDSSDTSQPPTEKRERVKKPQKKLLKPKEMAEKKPRTTQPRVSGSDKDKKRPKKKMRPLSDDKNEEETEIAGATHKIGDKCRLVSRGSSGSKIPLKSRSAQPTASADEDPNEDRRKRPLEKKNKQVRRKRSHVDPIAGDTAKKANHAVPNAEPQVDSAQAKAATCRQHRKQKLNERRLANGGQRKMDASKLKRTQSPEASKEKILLERKGTRSSMAGADADVGTEVEAPEGQVATSKVTENALTQSQDLVGDGRTITGIQKEESVLDMLPIPRKIQSGEQQNQQQESQDCDQKMAEASLDTLPIPRKARGGEEHAVITSTTSFVIPKPSFVKPTAGRPTQEPYMTRTAPNSSYGGSYALESRIAVATKPLPSPESVPHISNRDPMRPQRKRTKNPVPVKNSMFSSQDRSLMRLAKKRNSIFMAATELSAQVPGFQRASVTHMMGYEVYDVDGKVLPDLIPRLSCATKREMAADKDLYGASFFGVAISAPEAKGTSEAKSDDACEDTETNAKTVNCYEELRFERPEDREFYQHRMYGAKFVPQHLRGRITLIVRNARFERKSTGIRFNQDRDREEFSASLSKRYTFNKSVPRCEIPRDNWQKLMRNRTAAVYLHYYNREDAERASHVFRDDNGNPLEFRREYKAGVVISRSSSPASAGQVHRTPRRSCSSERGAPEPSPSSSQNNSVRNTPSSRRERVLDAPSPIQKQVAPLASPTRSPATDTNEGRQKSDDSGHWKQNMQDVHDDGEEGEVTSNTDTVPAVLTNDDHVDEWRGRQRSRSRSLSRQWQEQPHDVRTRQWREGYADKRRDRSRQPGPDYRAHNQHLDRTSERRRSRSRPRSNVSPLWNGRGDGWEDSYANDQRHPQDFQPVGSYNKNGRGRRMYPDDLERYKGRDNQNGRYEDRRGGPYSRPY